MSKILFKLAGAFEKIRDKRISSITEIIDKEENLTKSDLQEYRNLKFIELFKFVFANNKFYKKKYTEAGIKENDIKSLDDIVKLPVLTKSEIKKYRNEIETDSIPESECITRTSGGTTGEPIYVKVDFETRYLELYAYYRGMKWMGYQPGDSMVKFFGGSLGGNNSPTIRNKIKKFISGELFLPAFKLSKENARQFLEIIKNRGNTHIQGYVSSLYTLALYTKELNFKGLKIKRAFTTAEQIFPFQRDFIKEIFNCEVKSFYGCSEVNSVGYQAKENGPYIIPSEICYLENTVHPETNIQNSFLITALNNKKTPLIRYLNGDSGDLNRLDYKHDLIENISGRTSDNFIKKDGSLISSILATQTMQVSGLTQKVKRYQMIQEDYDYIKILIEPFDISLTEEEKTHIKNIYLGRIGKEFKIDIIESNEFIISKSGKHRLMINKIMDKI